MYLVVALVFEGLLSLAILIVFILSFSKMIAS